MKIVRFSFILFYIMLCESLSNDAQTSISLKTDKVGIQKTSDFWYLRFLCISHISPCIFKFILLPPGWTNQGQKVKVPIEDTLKTRSYFLNVVISQPTGQSAQKDIVLYFDEQGLNITSRNKPTQGNIEKVVIERKNQQKILSNFNPKNKQQLTWLQENNIVAYIPTIERLDQIISKYDIAQVSILVQNIVSDKSDCSQKIQYLKKVQDHLDKKIDQIKKVLNQKNAASQNAKNQIQMLTEQKQKVKEQLKKAEKNSMQGLQKRQKQLQDQRSFSYSKFTTFTIVSNKYLQKYQNYINNSGTNPEELKRVNKQILQDQEQIEAINKQIQELMEKKKLLERRLNSNKHKVRNSRTASNITPTKLKSLQDNFKKFKNMAAQYKLKFMQAQRQLQKIKQDLLKVDDNKDLLKQRLSDIDKEIQSYQNIDNGQDFSVQQLRLMIQTLERNVPNIQKSVNDCQEVLQQRNKPKQPILIVDIRPLIIQDNLQNAIIPPRQQFLKFFPILLQINVYSTDWILKYGVPYPNSFDCAIKENPARGYGIITEIQKSIIRVRDVNNNIFGLDLGICSDVRAMRSNLLPQKGDIIDWQGDLISFNVANVHKARIFRNSQ